MGSFRTALVSALDHHSPRSAYTLRRLRDSAIRLANRDIVSANRRATLESEPWFIDELRVSPGEVLFRGWAFPPMHWTREVAAQFALNGHLFDSTQYSIRTDVASKFWQRERAEHSGVVCRSANSNPFGADGFLSIEYLNPPAKLPRGLRHAWSLYDPAAESILPSSIQRTRVIGNDDEFGFRLTGATDFGRLARAVEVFSGRPMEAFESILDWGVGCGRVARYATKRVPARAFSGCDVDEENVRWCRENLPGTYHHTPMFPPLPFPEASYDLVYGISVFTHFKEALQDAWLADLRKILVPGGICLVTTHGRTTIEYAGLKPREYVDLKDSLARRGIVVGGQNDQLDGAVEHSSEYVNTFHSMDYITRRWSEHFEILGIVPGYIFTHDLVVLRAR
jgi:SAM-dependent methyltransferase